MEKTWFLPGQLVTLKQDLPNKPTMIVIGKETKLIKDDEQNGNKSFLKGIKCRWFTVSGELQEAVWNTKDLIEI